MYVTKFYYIAMLSLTAVSFLTILFFGSKKLTPKQKDIDYKITKYLLTAFVICNLHILLDELF